MAMFSKVSQDEKFHHEEEEDDCSDDDWRHVLSEPHGHFHLLGALAQIFAAVSQHLRLG